MTDPRDLVPTYLHWRELSREINGGQLVPRLSKSQLEQGGRDLGMLVEGTFVFNSEDESSVLMDHCLHDLREHGRSVAQQCLAEQPFKPGSERAEVLAAIAGATFGVIMVEAVVPGAGVQVLDILHDERFFLADVGFSRTGVPLHALATRLIRGPGFQMTGGAALPLFDQDALGAIRDHLRALRVESLPDAMRDPEWAAGLATYILRTCLAHGASERIGYGEPGQALAGPRPRRGLGAPVARQLPVRREPQPGRNEPCPCGSGRKYKKCHGQEA